MQQQASQPLSPRSLPGFPRSPWPDHGCPCQPPACAAAGALAQSSSLWSLSGESNASTSRWRRKAPNRGHLRILTLKGSEFKRTGEDLAPPLEAIPLWEQRVSLRLSA